jgi:hypothetical protein
MLAYEGWVKGGETTQENVRTLAKPYYESGYTTWAMVEEHLQQTGTTLSAEELRRLHGAMNVYEGRAAGVATRQANWAAYRENMEKMGKPMIELGLYNMDAVMEHPVMGPEVEVWPEELRAALRDTLKRHTTWFMTGKVRPTCVALHACRVLRSCTPPAVSPTLAAALTRRALLRDVRCDATCVVCAHRVALQKAAVAADARYQNDARAYLALHNDAPPPGAAGPSALPDEAQPAAPAELPPLAPPAVAPSLPATSSAPSQQPHGAMTSTMNTLFTKLNAATKKRR